MFIKSISIFGFKSFADRIQIKLEKGITAVVGPNGSGKSNISDAIRWVLGEQSPKYLRGGKMEDVIFAGTQKRKSLGFAEVTLNIDNSANVLHYPEKNISVTRKSYRSSENEYLINQKRCRLKDVTDLFLDTGLAKEGYSIIGQGKIDEILSTHPEDRRMVFEQAAGIARFKLRKDEALGKLHKTNENILRINLVLDSLEQQLYPLHSQREKAIEYLDIKEKLQELEVGLFLAIVSKNAIKNEKLQNAISAHDEEIADLSNKLRLEEEIILETKKTTLLISRSLEQNVLNKHNREMRSNSVSTEIGILSSEIDAINIENQKLKLEQSESESQNSAICLSLQEAESVLISKKTVLSEEENLLYTLEKKLDILKTEISQSEESKIELQISNLNDELIKVKSDVVKYETIKEALFDSINRQESELKHTGNRLSELSDETMVVAMQIENGEIELASLRLSSLSLEDKLTFQKNKLNENENLLAINKQKIAEAKAKLDTIEQMQVSMEGFAIGVKNVMKAYGSTKLPSVKIHGVLADLIDVEDQYKVAIEACLGSSLQNIVIDTEADAKKIIEYLRENSLGRATFLPLSTARPRCLTNEEIRKLKFFTSIGIAAEIIRFDDIFRPIFDSLLGRTVVTETLDQAICIAKEFKYSFRLVTLKADVFNPGGSITGGEIFRKSSNVLGRNKEIAKLRDIVAILRNNEKELIGQIDTMRLLLNQGKSDLESTSEKIRGTEVKLVLLKRNFDLLSQEKNKLEIDYELNNSELKSKKEKQVLDEKKLADLNILVNSLSERFERHKALKKESESIFREMLNKLEKSNNELSALNASISDLRKEIAILNERKHFCTLEQKRALTQIDKVLLTLAGNDNLLKDKNLQMEVKTEELKLIESQSKELIKESEKLDADRMLYTSKIEEQEYNVSLFRKKIDECKDDRNRYCVLQSKLEAEIEGINNAMWEKYGLSFGNASNKYVAVDNLTEADRQIKELKSSIMALGEVNVNSIEDYKTLKSKFDFISDQKQDLEEARKNLDKVIEEITNSMTKIFLEEFNIINYHFTKVFERLFGGGNAKLKLEDEAHPLQCGIEIVAQPPGKSLQNISLLSGGEKALTASAILFAILSRKPARFCVLDEIDAVLDESNLHNLGLFLKEFSDNTQFMVITHRKTLMEMCDTLYGVVMEEKGISKLVSVKMEEIPIV